MNITPEEAARSLQEVEASRRAMRSVVRAHRGHLYLWLWGLVWIICSILNWANPGRFWITSNWVAGAGVVATIIIGFVQSSQVRSKVDKRFLAVCFTILAFGYVAWPTFLGAPHTSKSAFGYGTLLWMQVYVVAGIWFDNYWLWIGVAVTALILAVYIFFPEFFWAGTLLCGVTMVATGFYVRLFWR
jgi:hypothetical protein